MRNAGYLCLGLGFILTGVQISLFRDQLPQRMASHFGPNGQPDGWMARDAFLGTYIAIQLAVPALLLGIAKFARVLPVEFFNMPNREYWLAECRKEETFRYNEGILIWIAGLTSLFLCVVLWFVIDANQKQQGLNLPVFASVLAGYFVIVLASVIQFSRKFWSIT